MGKVRKGNEDNFYCNGQYRRDVYSLEDEFFCGEVLSDTNELFAVFDGMGGEACGEIASFIAASHCELFCKERDKYDEYLYELCDILNRRICDETAARSLVLMGTTAAMIQFNKSDIYVLNIGDSRIYKLSHHKLKRISEDHVAYGYSSKPPLTRFLGSPYSAGNPIKPYIAMGKYKVSDIFMLCSDGITDMISEDDIQNIIDQKKSLEELSEELINAAMDNGGVDNATVILCKIENNKKHR